MRIRWRGYALPLQRANPLRRAASSAQRVCRGTQLRVLSGNPKQTGIYTIMIKLPKNTVIEPHSYPDDRVGTVVSGSFYFAFGDTFDES
jgi:hypothetical protein